MMQKHKPIWGGGKTKSYNTLKSIKKMIFSICFIVLFLFCTLLNSKATVYAGSVEIPVEVKKQIAFSTNIQELTPFLKEGANLGIKVQFQFQNSNGEWIDDINFISCNNLTKNEFEISSSATNAYKRVVDSIPLIANENYATGNTRESIIESDKNGNKFKNIFIIDVSEPEGTYLNEYDDKNQTLLFSKTDGYLALRVQKIDSDTGNLLTGSVYQLKGIDDFGRFVDKTIRIGTNTELDMYFGEYTLKEVEAPYGYQLDTTEHSLIFHSDAEVKLDGKLINNYIVTLQDEPKEQIELTVKKIWDDNNNDLKKRPAMATFSILDGEDVIKTFRTGTSYTTSINKYADNGEEIEYIVQEEDVDGYVSEVGQIVDMGNNKKEITVTNHLIDDRLIIQKRDQYGNEVPNALLQLTAADGSIQTTWRMKRGSDWRLSLSDGTYTISEIETPNKYKTADPITFEYHDHTVYQNGIASGNKITLIDEKIDPKGNVSILKIDAETRQPLKDAVFSLSGTSDNGRNISMKKTTDTQGKAVFSDVPVGTYEIKEVSAPNGYIKNNDVETATIGITAQKYEWEELTGADDLDPYEEYRFYVYHNGEYKPVGIDSQGNLAVSNSNNKSSIITVGETEHFNEKNYYTLLVDGTLLKTKLDGHNIIPSLNQNGSTNYFYIDENKYLYTNDGLSILDDGLFISDDLKLGFHYSYTTQYPIKIYRYAAKDVSAVDASLITVANYKMKQGSVVVEHRDAETKELLEPASTVVDNGLVGETYTTNSKTFDGYTFLRHDAASDPVTGKVEEGTKTVVYLYEKDKGTVLIEHRDIETNELLEETGVVKENERVGTEYTTSNKSFTNYTFVKHDDSSAPASGTVKKDTQTVIYLYRHDRGSVKVVYKDIDTDEILDGPTMVKDNTPTGENYSTEQKEFEDYTFVKTEGDDPTGVVEKGEKEVVYLYRKNTGSVYVEHRDIETSELLEDTATIKEEERIGTNYTTASKEFADYSFVRHDGESAPIEGTVKKDPQTVVYLYRHDKGSVYVEHRDIETGKLIAPRGTVQDAVNTSTAYATSESSFDGYRFVRHDETSDQVSGTVKTEDQTVIYLYERIRGTVLVEYRDIDTNDPVADPKLVAENEPTGEAYTTYPIDVNKYTFVRHDQTSDATEGIVEEGTKTVVYLYQKNRNNVFVEHYDMCSGELLDAGTVVANVKLDTPYEAKESSFDGYRFIKWNETSTEEKGVVTEELQNIIYLYAKEYTEHYRFVSGVEGKDLPESIQALLPDRAEKYINGDEVFPAEVTQTKLKDEEGEWVFYGWDIGSHIIENGDAYFVGMWNYIYDPVITIEKSVDKDSVKAGETVTFAITAASSRNDAKNAVVTDPFVDGIEIDTKSIETNYEDAKISVTYDNESAKNVGKLLISTETLQENKPLVITFNAKITKEEGAVINIATLTADACSQVEDQAEVTIIPEEKVPDPQPEPQPEPVSPEKEDPIKPEMTIEKSVDKETVKLDETVLYTITATAKNADVFEAVVTDLADIGIKVNGDSIKTNYEGARFFINGQKLTISVDKLSVDKPLIITYEAAIHADKETTLNNTAMLTGKDADGNDLTPVEAAAKVRAEIEKEQTSANTDTPTKTEEDNTRSQEKSEPVPEKSKELTKVTVKSVSTPAASSGEIKSAGKVQTGDWGMGLILMGCVGLFIGLGIYRRYRFLDR